VTRPDPASAGESLHRCNVSGSRWALRSPFSEQKRGVVRLRIRSQTRFQAANGDGVFICDAAAPGRRARQGRSANAAEIRGTRSTPGSPC